MQWAEIGAVWRGVVLCNTLWCGVLRRPKLCLARDGVNNVINCVACGVVSRAVERRGCDWRGAGARGAAWPRARVCGVDCGQHKRAQICTAGHGCV